MTSGATHRPPGGWPFTAPDKILAATDLTDLDYLLPNAIAQCRDCRASLTLAHAISPMASTGLEASFLLVADVGQARAQQRLHQAQNILAGAAEQVRAAGIHCETVLHQGHPSFAIAELASRVHAGRLILGTHGRRNPAKFILGSTAHEILQNTNVPVWTIGPHARPFAYGQPSRILHPVSLSPGYQETANLAVAFAQSCKAEITLLHVLPRDVHAEYALQPLVQKTARELARLIPDESALWSTAQIRVEAGEVVAQIIYAAEDVQADLILMGCNPDTAFWPIRSEFTVYSVIAQAKCPVLTLRPSHTPDPKPASGSLNRP